LEEIFALFPKLRILQRARAESLSGGEHQMLAIVLVNGQIAYEGSAGVPERDTALRARLLGVVQPELTTAE
jgi:hypothetical protein